MLPFARPAFFAAALTVLSACQLETGGTPQTFEEMQAERLAVTQAKVENCRDSLCGRLNLDSGYLADYSQVADMPHITAFMASFTDFNDLADIAPMVQLRELHIGRTQVTDLSGLSNFPNLTLLHAQDLQVNDYDDIAQLRGLQELALGGSDVGDMIFVSKLTALRSLNLSRADISSLEALRRHPSLEKLDLDLSTEADFSVLLTIPNLKEIYITPWSLSEAQQAVIDALEAKGVIVTQEVAVIVC